MSIIIIVFLMVHKRPSGSCVNHGLQPANLEMKRVIISGLYCIWERTGKTLLTSAVLNMSTIQLIIVLAVL